MAKFPSKPRTGLKTIASLYRSVNEIIDYLPSLSVKSDGKSIKVQNLSDGTIISVKNNGNQDWNYRGNYLRYVFGQGIQSYYDEEIISGMLGASKLLLPLYVTLNIVGDNQNISAYIPSTITEPVLIRWIGETPSGGGGGGGITYLPSTGINISSGNYISVKLSAGPNINIYEGDDNYLIISGAISGGGGGGTTYQAGTYIDIDTETEPNTINCTLSGDKTYVDILDDVITFNSGTLSAFVTSTWVDDNFISGGSTGTFMLYDSYHKRLNCTLTAGNWIWIDELDQINCTLTGLDQLDNTPGFITTYTDTTYNLGYAIVISGDNNSINVDTDIIATNDLVIGLCTVLSTAIDYVSGIVDSTSAALSSHIDYVSGQVIHYTGGTGIGIDPNTHVISLTSDIPVQNTYIGDEETIHLGGLNNNTFSVITTTIAPMSTVVTLSTQLSGAIDSVSSAIDYVSSNIPTKVSELENDSGFITSYVNNTYKGDDETISLSSDNETFFVIDGVFAPVSSINTLCGHIVYLSSGIDTLSSAIDYVSGKIPTKVSELDNDLGFITSYTDTTYDLGYAIIISGDNNSINVDTTLIATNDLVVTLSTQLSGHIDHVSGAVDAVSSAIDYVSSNIPTKTSDLTNDSGFITSYTDTTYEEGFGIIISGDNNSINVDTDIIATNDTVVSISSIFSGAIDYVSGIVDSTSAALSSHIDYVSSHIPTKVSELENDSGFITSYTDTTYDLGYAIVISGDNNSINVDTTLIATQGDVSILSGAIDLLSGSIDYVSGGVDSVSSAIDYVSSKIPTKVSELDNDEGFITEYTNTTYDLGIGIIISGENNLINVDPTWLSGGMSYEGYQAIRAALTGLLAIGSGNATWDGFYNPSMRLLRGTTPTTSTHFTYGVRLSWLSEQISTFLTDVSSHDETLNTLKIDSNGYLYWGIDESGSSTPCTYYADKDTLSTINNGNTFYVRNIKRLLSGTGGISVSYLTTDPAGHDITLISSNIPIPCTYLAGTGLALSTDNKTFYLTANIPTKTSDLTNDSNFITSSNIPTYIGTSGIAIEKILDSNNKPTTSSNVYISAGFYDTLTKPTKNKVLSCSNDGTISWVENTAQGGGGTVDVDTICAMLSSANNNLTITKADDKILFTATGGGGGGGELLSSMYITTQDFYNITPNTRYVIMVASDLSTNILANPPSDPLPLSAWSTDYRIYKYFTWSGGSSNTPTYVLTTVFRADSEEYGAYLNGSWKTYSPGDCFGVYFTIPSASANSIVLIDCCALGNIIIHPVDTAIVGSTGDGYISGAYLSSDDWFLAVGTGTRVILTYDHAMNVWYYTTYS